MKTLHAYCAGFNPMMAVQILAHSGLRWRMHPMQACAVTQAMILSVGNVITVEKKEPVDLSTLPPLSMAAIEILQDPKMVESEIELLFGDTVIGKITGLAIPA